MNWMLTLFGIGTARSLQGSGGLALFIQLLIAPLGPLDRAIRWWADIADNIMSLPQHTHAAA